MQAKRLDDTLSVSVQISPDDVATLRDAGFRALICNRPDGESGDQPAYAEIATAAAAAGLPIHFQPVVASQITEADADRFAATVQSLPGPVLAYCRTGTRSTTLWALAAARTQPVAQVLETARAAGYDLSTLAPRLQARARPAG